ncbi:hypothetical protein [Neobacillus kokaensis]|uniref:Menaquinol-cytochrome c reductase cytochrome b subunit n=1 Tax=Neobacillus kokaensis TaxID=2759023 RepID=A0ABQ3N2G4_9BACI|nr:hypothetical protein [Neobacillus kokaensis]GHH98784.1 hypothetical protein AM1BK_23270 [Neobacillus kokaensis]
MKLVLQACIGAVIIHLIYLVSTILIGYIKTKYYEPDVANKWETVHTLQNKAAFGSSISPLFFLLTLAGTAMVCGVILIFYKRILG